MHFDGTITLGNVLTIVGMVVGLLGIYNKIAERLIVLEVKVNDLWERRGKLLPHARGDEA